MTSEELLTPENEYECRIVEYCTQMSQTILRKNRSYGDSYKNSREECRTIFGNAKIPFYMHIIEKLRRYINCEDGEDSLQDLACYAVLETVSGGMMND